MRTILLAASILSLHAAEALAQSAEMGTVPARMQPMQLSTVQFDPLPSDIVTIRPRPSSVPGAYEQRSDNDNYRNDFRMLNFGL